MKQNPDYRYRNTGDKNYNEDLYRFCVESWGKAVVEKSKQLLQRNDLASLRETISLLQDSLKIYERKSLANVEKPQQRQYEEAQAAKWQAELGDLQNALRQQSQKIDEDVLRSFNPLLALMDILDNSSFSTPADKLRNVARDFYEENPPAPQDVDFEFAKNVLQKIIVEIDPETLKEFFNKYNAPAIQEASMGGGLRGAKLNLNSLTLDNFLVLLHNCGSPENRFATAKDVVNESRDSLTAVRISLEESLAAMQNLPEDRPSSVATVDDDEDEDLPLLVAIRGLQQREDGDLAPRTQPASPQPADLQNNGAGPDTRPASPEAAAANNGQGPTITRL